MYGYLRAAVPRTGGRPSRGSTRGTDAAQDAELKVKREALFKEKDKVSAESPVIPTWAWDRVDRWTYAPTLAETGPAVRKGKRRP